MSWKEIWDKINWADAIHYFRFMGGACVKCGGQVTVMNLKFFGFDAEKALCYKCQNKAPESRESQPGAECRE